MPDRPVLFLPGTLCTGEVFLSQAEALAPHASEILVAPFRRERSITEMAETAAAQIPEGSRAAVIGFSMGGMAALLLADRYPQRVDRLALLNSNTHPDLPGRDKGRQKYIQRARQSSLRSVLEQGFLQNYLLRQETAHRDLILDMAETLGLEAFEAQSAALASRPDTGPLLERLQCPVLIIGAEQDVLCPPATQVEMYQKASNGKLVMLDNCGHFAVLEKPWEVNQALLEWFLAGVA
ncbi:MAG: alpha/beta hydrolase [Xanthomonadales bacterium]|jgi:pimeloyl-ACP methyl ester carboxylesterase|nr:alpha/beta hydrolase [Xanthomonadales bacterium]